MLCPAVARVGPASQRCRACPRCCTKLQLHEGLSGTPAKWLWWAGACTHMHMACSDSTKAWHVGTVCHCGPNEQLPHQPHSLIHLGALNYPMRILRSQCTTSCIHRILLCPRTAAPCSSCALFFTWSLPDCPGTMVCCRPEIQECVKQMNLSGLADYCNNDPECAAFVYKPGVLWCGATGMHAVCLPDGVG